MNLLFVVIEVESPAEDTIDEKGEAVPVVGGVDCFEKADGWDVLIPPNTEDVVVLGVPELKLANGEAEVADVPPNTELEAIKEKKIVKSKYWKKFVKTKCYKNYQLQSLEELWRPM